MGDASENSESRLIDANTDRLAGSQENIADIARGDMLRQLGLAMASGFQPRMDTHRGGALFLIGAGCSRSAGVPLGWEVAGIACAMMAEKLDRTERFRLDDDLATNESRFEDALKYLQKKGYLDHSTSLATGYSVIFQKLFSDQSQQNEVISKALAFGGNQINWAHICLGQLVHERYVHTVLTTNFDTLILDGIVRCGTIPAVSDSLDTINRIRGKSPHPQLVHLHGSRHAYSQYNKADDLKHTANRDDLKHMIAELLRDSTALVVVGYAGGEEAVMEHVIEAVKRYPDKPIFWVTKSTNLATQSERTKELLENSDAARRPRYFMGGWDADDFFRNLMQELGVRLPHWMLDPVQFWTDRSKEIVKPVTPSTAQENTIAALIDNFAKRLQQLQDCQSRCEDADSPQVAERIRQHIASGNIDGVIREIESADRMEFYRDTLAEVLSLIVDRAKSTGSHDLMNSALWCVDKIHECVEASGVQWLGSESVLGEIYRAFRSFFLIEYSKEIRSHALDVAKKGLKVRLNLEKQHPKQFAAAVAEGWHQLSNRFFDVGETKRALHAIRKAVAIRQKLAAENPGRFTPDLADSLFNLSLRLSDAGDQKGALAAITRAVEIYESLAAENPGRFNPDLAMSLNNLSIRRADAGDQTGALAAIARAVEIGQSLAAENPGRFNPDLAMSLNNLSKHLSDADDQKGALAAIARAVEIRESLAAENPGRFNPDLAMSLNNLSVSLSDAGDQKGALAAIARAVEIRQSLATENPGRFNPDLAVSLANLAWRTDDNGDRGEAIRLMEEAITRITPQADAYPGSEAGRWRTQMQRDLARWRDAVPSGD